MIPARINVGYQKRTDTYTQKLGYVIYFDHKGKLRKEASWQTWRDKKIAPTDFENKPMSGFVLNKKAGGYKTGWDVRRTVVRVYDPRDFEFEISVPNLLFILQETSAIKGKGLEGEFVYAWDGSELVLLPTCSAEYQDCVKFTSAQAAKVGKADMVEGCTYQMKDMTNVMYLGRHHFAERSGWSRENYTYTPVGLQHVFLRLDKKKADDEYGGEPYIIQGGFTKIAARTSEEPSPDYANAYDKFRKSKYHCKVVDVKLVKKTISIKEIESGRDQLVLVKEGDRYYPLRVWKKYGYNSWRSDRYTEFEMGRGPEFKPVLQNGICVIPKTPYRYGNTEGVEGVTENELKAKDAYTAILVTENGHEVDLTKGQ